MIIGCAWACVVCCRSTVLWHSSQHFQAKGPNLSAIASCYHTIKLHQLQHACCLSCQLPVGRRAKQSMTPARKVSTLLLVHTCTSEKGFQPLHSTALPMYTLMVATCTRSKANVRPVHTFPGGHKPTVHSTAHWSRQSRKPFVSFHAVGFCDRPLLPHPSMAFLQLSWRPPNLAWEHMRSMSASEADGSSWGAVV